MRSNWASVLRSTGSSTVVSRTKRWRASSAARPSDAPASTRWRKYWQIRSAAPLPSAGP